MLAVIETHPVQYHAPVYRALQQQFGVPVTAIYGSDFSVQRYRDAEFGAAVTWDTDLLSGYSHRFLSRSRDATEPDLGRLSAHGIGELLREIRPAATLLLGYSPAFHRRAWYAAWRLGRPLLFRGETTDRAQTTSHVKSALRRAGLRRAYRTCARLLYIGTRSHAHYRQLGVDEDRLVFSPYCVDTTPFRMDEDARAACRDRVRASLGARADRVVLLYAGKLSERKGVDLLPAAMRALPDGLRTRISLVVLGDGALREKLERGAREAGVDVRMLGVQAQGSLSDYYHAADLLVLPSRHGETWGLVVNEALHHGVPCVTSDRVGCAPDLVDESTGVVCDADSSDALARAIVAAQLLVGRPEIRERCRQRAAIYSVSHAAQGIAEAYHAVVDDHVAA
jgi:glycosyltransferase involved in cell wall biosynthesis